MQAIFPLSANYKDMTWLLWGVGMLFLETTFILIPALISYQLKKYTACIAACITLLPFVFYTDIVEFWLPYRGGGASMVGIIIFFPGLPLSILMAVVFSFLAKKNAEIPAR